MYACVLIPLCVLPKTLSFSSNKFRQSNEKWARKLMKKLRERTLVFVKDGPVSACKDTQHR